MRADKARTSEGARTDLRGLAKRKRVEETQRTFELATQVMERTANRVIERIIRQGFVERSDVRKLRSGDELCRKALQDLNEAKEALRVEG